jgi:hypothetical protein
LEKRFRLPIIDIAIPALKQLSGSQYPSFKENLLALVDMDDPGRPVRMVLAEDPVQPSGRALWQKRHHGHDKATMRIPANSHGSLGLVLSVIAYAGAADQGSAQSAFDASAQSLADKGLALLAKDQIRLADLDQALGTLDRLAPADKSRLLTACVISTWHDQRATPTEVELLRAFASVLDCPMPPGMAPGARHDN